MNRPPVGIDRDCSTRIRTGPDGGAPRSELRTTPCASITAAARALVSGPAPGDEQADGPVRRDGTQVVRLQTRHDDDAERLRVRVAREGSREET